MWAAAAGLQHPGADPEIELGIDRSRWPRRDPSAPPELVDLSKHYNGLLTISWNLLGGTYEDGNDLAGLPQGVTPLANTPFDVRGIVQVDQGSERFPERAEGIEVNRGLRRLHVLHATVGSAGEGEHVGSLVLNYAEVERILEEAGFPIPSGLRGRL